MIPIAWLQSTILEINPGTSWSNLHSPVLWSSRLCLLSSAVYLSNYTSHMLTSPDICKPSLKLMTREAADSSQMCEIFWVGDMRVWWCLCVCESLHINPHVLFHQTEPLQPCDTCSYQICCHCSLFYVTCVYSVFVDPYMWYVLFIFYFTI